MKKLSVLILVLLILLMSSCSKNENSCEIVATTLPVYEFTTNITKDTPLSVGRLVTENVSCLHDYTLQVSQMRMIENAEVIILSGAGLEEFLEDALSSAHFTIDCSTNTHIHEGGHPHEDHEEDHSHHHERDPHIWLSPENAAIMATNICEGLIKNYPQYSDVFQSNLNDLLLELEKLQDYGDHQLSEIACRELITFHDGFAYFAESFDLEILKAIEEESGSEASAAEIIALIDLIDAHRLPAVFTEKSGSDACAGIICAETGVGVYTLDMAMAGDSYFDAMYHNIDTIKEALS